MRYHSLLTIRNFSLDRCSFHAPARSSSSSQCAQRFGSEVATFHSSLTASAYGYQHPARPTGLSPRSLRCDLQATHSLHARNVKRQKAVERIVKFYSVGGQIKSKRASRSACSDEKLFKNRTYTGRFKTSRATSWPNSTAKLVPRSQG